MKIIFLDIDGVLNSYHYLMRGPSIEDRDMPLAKDDQAREIDPDAVTLLNNVLQKTNAKIVVSSSWRYSFDTFEELKACLLRAGINQVIGSTPILEGDRWEEVNTWLVQNSNKVTTYAIIDDSFGPIGSLDKNRLVHTQWATGITLKDVDQLIEILK